MATNTSTIGAIGRTSATARPGMLQGVRAAFERWQERAQIRFELAQMSTRELADLGLNPSDIDEVARGSYRRED